jgi:hypothetical protein
MQTIELTDLEVKTINTCNELLKEHDLEVNKIKNGRNVKYCITREGYELLCNTDLVAVDTFCRNPEDIKTLASVADNTVAMKKAKTA